MIGSTAFNELRKMRNLEALTAYISEDCAGELENVIANDDMDASIEDFLTLSRSSHNLKHIEIQC